MPLDLNSIYDKGVNDTPDVPKPTKRFNLDDVVTPVNLHAQETISNYNPDEYTGYLNEPLYEAKGDPNVRRGLAQSGWDKFGNFVAQTGLKTITGITEGLGYLGSLVGEWGDDRDYSNAVTESSIKANSWIDKNFPLYRHNNDTWALNDASWWLQNAQGLVSSVGAFALEGGIFGAAISASRVGEGIEALSGLAKIGARGARGIGQVGEELLTSGMLAYTEGAMSGKRVFDTVYQTQLQKNLRKKHIDGTDYTLEEADQEAKHTAAQSAASAVQLNTIINTGSNFFGGVGEFFNHEKSAVIKTIEKNLLAKNGENISETLTRLGTETAEKYAKELATKKSIGHILKEATAEGVEELTNQFAERTGIEEGQQGKTHGFFNQLGQLENYFKRTMDSEGALNFVMGAIAGPLQHGLANNIPIHRIQTGVQTNEDGSLVEEGNKKQYVPGMFGTNYVTKKTVNQFGANEYFTKIKDKIVADYTEMSKLQQGIDQAISSGNPVLAESLRERLFNVANLNSVKMGFGEGLKNTYKTILDLDNTRSPKNEKEEALAKMTEQLQEAKDQGEDTTELEANVTSLKQEVDSTPDTTPAMKLNMTDSRENNDYKKKATEAIETIDELQKIHDTVMKKYGPEEGNLDVEQEHISDMIFHKLANLHLLKKEKTKVEDKLAELDAPDAVDFLTSPLVQEHDRKIDRLRDKLLVVEKDIADLKSTDTSKHKALIAKYGAIGVDDSDNSSALKAVGDKLNKIHTSVTDRIDEEHQNVLNSEFYQKWAQKNSDKSYTDFEQSLPKAVKDSQLQRQLSQHLTDLENQIQTHTEFAQELQQTPTMTKVLRNTTKYFEKLRNQEAQETLELLREREIRLETAQLSKRRQYLELSKLQKAYAKELESIQEEKKQITKELKKLTRSINLLLTDMSDSDAPYRLQEWKDKRNELRQRQANIKSRITVLQTLFNQAEQAKAATITPVQEEEIKNEEEESEVAQTEVEETEEETQESTEEEAPPVQETEKVEPIQTPKMDSLMSILQEIPDKGLVSARFNDGKVTSLDSLKDLNLGKYTSPQVVLALREAAQEAGQVLQDLQEDEEEMDVDTTLEVEPVPVEELPTTGVTHDGIVTNNSKPEPDAVTPDDSLWRGKKQVNPSNSTAIMTSEYRETEKLGPDGILVKDKESTGKLNKDTSPDILSPRKLLPGTAVRIELDTESEGFQQMLDAEDIDNIPIKIVYPDGTSTGMYLHTVDWVTEEIEGSTLSERFRSTADIVEGVPGNVANEATRLRDLRSRLTQKFKQDGTGIETKISDKGTGTVEFENSYRLASGPSGLPGVQLGIVKGNSIISAAIGSQETSVPSEWEGRTVGLIRSANGSIVPVTLQGNLLFERGQHTRDYDNFVRITEIHLTPNLTKSQEEAKIIKEATGFDVLTQQGYRDYIVQHLTYLTTEADFLKSGKPNFLDVRKPIEGELNSQIKIGNWYQGSTKPTITILAVDGATGKLRTEHKKAVQEFFSKRFKSVALEDTDRGIKGIQSTEEFKEANYDPKTRTWSVTKNTDYSSYIKKSLYTNVRYYGKSGDTHVYFNNPVIKFDTKPILELPTFEFKKDFTMDVNPVDKFQSLLHPEDTTLVVGTTDDPSKQVTPENLQKWYEEAEDHEDYNGADIAELSTSLSANGITFVESNPFLSPC